jgi:hypothetical protein
MWRPLLIMWEVWWHRGGVVAQWIEHRTADARVLVSNPGTSHQGWDYWQSPVTPLLGGQNKGLAGATASVTSAAAAPASDSLQAGGLGGAGLWYLLAIWSLHHPTTCDLSVTSLVHLARVPTLDLCSSPVGGSVKYKPVKTLLSQQKS